MTSIRYLEFLLFLLFQSVYSEKPEPVFRAQGSNIEMGYCFGVDYIVVYRSFPEGDQLLGNSSANTPSTLPADLRGRIHINQRQFLLGLQILNLTPMDSAVYRKECWQNQSLVSQLTQQLFVCNEEIESEEIIVKKEDEATELLCNSTSIRLEGTSVVWYHEMYPSYKLTLFLDSSVSLEPLVEEMQSLVKVKDKGALLVLDNSMLKNNQQFHCLVFKGKNCLSLQNMYLPDHSESREVFASQGEKIVLNCPANGYNQHWETPLGRINSSSMTQTQMYLTSGDKDFSLVIPSVSDEHSGDYSCISSSREIQYLLVLCPIKLASPPQKTVFEGENITLECDDNQLDHRVQWYRRQTSKKHMTEIINDSNDFTVFIPEDLKGRLILSKMDFSLTISSLEINDGGVYFCVVFRGLEFLEEDDYTVDDYTEEDTGDDEFSDDQNWNDPWTCIFKQETIVTVKYNDQKQRLPKSETTPTADPPAASNVTAHVLGAGVVVLVVLVGVIVTVIALKRKAKASPKQRNAAYELNTKKDIYTKEDATTKMLTNDECWSTAFVK